MLNNYTVIIIFISLSLSLYNIVLLHSCNNTILLHINNIISDFKEAVAA